MGYPEQTVREGKPLYSPVTGDAVRSAAIDRKHVSASDARSLLDEFQLSVSRDISLFGVDLVSAVEGVDEVCICECDSTVAIARISGDVSVLFHRWMPGDSSEEEWFVVLAAMQAYASKSMWSEDSADQQCVMVRLVRYSELVDSEPGAHQPV